MAGGNNQGKKAIRLLGKVILKGELLAVTGLRVGGSGSSFEIGGNDNPVLRNPLNQEPYIPGSSLRGKLRALLDRQLGLPLNKLVKDVRIHECGVEEGNITPQEIAKIENEYLNCPSCQIFGVAPGEKVKKKFNRLFPGRLVVADIPLSNTSKRQLEAMPTDLPFTEIKTEIALDRVTCRANPRPIERVPAGTVFSPVELVYSFYALDGEEKQSLSAVIEREVGFLCYLLLALRALEDDYLGGGGSRGSGRVKFKKLGLVLRRVDYYLGKSAGEITLGSWNNVYSMVDNWEEIKKELTSNLTNLDWS